MTSARLPQDKKASFWRYCISLARRRRRKKNKTSASSLLRKSLGCHQLLNPFLLFNTERQFYILPWVTDQGVMTVILRLLLLRVFMRETFQGMGHSCHRHVQKGFVYFWDAVRINVIKKMWPLLITQTMKRTWGGAHSRLGLTCKIMGCKRLIIIL